MWSLSEDGVEKGLALIGEHFSTVSTQTGYQVFLGPSNVDVPGS